MSYTLPITVRVHDTDSRRLARPSSVWRYFQEAANYQMKVEGPSYDDLLSEGRAFLLSRMAVDFLRPVSQYEELKSETFPLPSGGFSFGRGYQLTDRDGEVVARGISLWAMTDINTRRLIRFGEVELHYTGGEDPGVECPLRFVIPDGVELREVGSRVVRYSDVDVNLHLNNTNYPDLFADFLPEPGCGELRSLSLHYRSEAPLGTTLTVLRGEETDGGITRYWFRTMNGDSVNAECRMEIAY